MTDSIVIRVDGGICSQVAFVALGLWLQRENRVKIKYDLSWFKECGKDLDGRFVRNWDMPKAFPELRLDVATEEEIRSLDDRGLVSSGFSCQNIKAPLHLVGYPERYEALKETCDIFRNKFKPDMSAFDLTCLDTLRKTTCACAVHVRRGDLSIANKAYGSPTSTNYYVSAMRIVKGLYPNVHFFIFSDEPDWVNKILIPALSADFTVDIIKGNGADRGYADLFLISKCPLIISSIGSLGVFAALLSNCNELLVMSRSREWVSHSNLNVIYLNDDREFYSDACSSNFFQKGEIKRFGIYKPLYKLWKRLGKVLVEPTR